MPLPTMVPSQIVSFSGVPSSGGLHNPGKCGQRRVPSSRNPIPVQDHDGPGRLVLGFHDNDRSRTSRGDTSETFEVALSRIMDEEDLNSFKTGIEFTCKSEFVERDALLRSELAQVVSVSNQKVVDLANENILQQQTAMSNKIAKLEAAAENLVQSEAAVARSALHNAEQKMSQENQK